MYENRYALPRERRLDRQQGWSGSMVFKGWSLPIMTHTTDTDIGKKI